MESSEGSEVTHRVHHGNSFNREVSFGRFSRQHDAVGSVQNRISHVAALCAGGSCMVHHTLQHLNTHTQSSLCQLLELFRSFRVSHLCGADHRFPCRITAPDHHLLRDEDFLGRDLDAQVTAGHHDAVALLQDLLETAERNEEM